MRAALVVLGLILAAVLSAGAQTASSPGRTLRVTAVNGAQAVLTDIQTWAQTPVQAGDTVNGWTVVVITPMGVDLEHASDETGIVQRAQLPAPPPSPTPSATP